MKTVPSQRVFTKPIKSNKPNEKVVIDSDAVDEELIFLDEIIASKNSNSLFNGTSTTINEIHPSLRPALSLLIADLKLLDIDTIMKRRFGGMAIDRAGDEEAGEQVAGGMGGRERRMLAATAAANKSKAKSNKIISKRLIFGIPKDDWVKPPSFSGGGMGMTNYNPVKINTTEMPYQYFKFIYSEEFSRLHEQYLIVSNSGDVNRLAMFLSQYPYHPEGFVQLAMVFARTGHMDRAVDFIRRAIYCLECAFCESFKPLTTGQQSTVKGGVLNQQWGGLFRIDPNLPENVVFFTALFRHMQMSAMLGCPSVSVEVAKIIYSLDPAIDRYNILLVLDYFLVSSGRNEDLLKFMGLLSDTTLAVSTPIISTSTLNEGIEGNNTTKKLTLSIWDIDVMEGKSVSFSSPLDSFIATEMSNRIKVNLQAFRTTSTPSVDINNGSSNMNDNSTGNDNIGNDVISEGYNSENTPVESCDINTDTNNEINETSDNNNEEEGEHSLVTKIHTLKLSDLSNWWYSLSLSCFTKQKMDAIKNSTISTNSKLKNEKINSVLEGNDGGFEKECDKFEELSCDEILTKTLSLWPYILEPLLRKVNVQVNSSLWRPIFTHTYFATVTTRFEYLVSSMNMN